MLRRGVLLVMVGVLVASGTVQASVISSESPPDRQPPWEQFYRYVDPTFPSFHGVFNLWLTESVETDWDSLLIADFIGQVMNEDSTDTDDVFPQIWDYFCFNDKDPSYTGVRFEIIETEYTKIDLLLFHQGDFHPECPKKSFCRGGGWHLAGTNGLYLSITNGPCGGPHSIRYIDVATYGTDYIIFRAGDYYQDGEEHEFRFYLSGNGPAVPANTRVVARAIGYSSEVRHSAARDRCTPTRKRLCLSSPFRSRA